MTTSFPSPHPLLGLGDDTLLARGNLLLVVGADGTGKSTFAMDGVAHMAAGLPWLGAAVARPVRFVLIENEGHPALFQRKLREQAKRC
jgi:RecA-family ATPase